MWAQLLHHSFIHAQILLRDGKSNEWVTINKFRLDIDKNNLNKT